MTTRTDLVKVTCFKCSKKFTYLWTEERSPFDPERDQIACSDCANDLGDYTMFLCWYCGVQFQEWDYGIFPPEACSHECQDAIDDRVERAQQMQHDAIERRLESL